MIDRICTAHKEIYQYIAAVKKDVQKKVYIAFHFIPSEPYDGKSDYYNYKCVPDGKMVHSLAQQAVNQVKK